MKQHSHFYIEQCKYKLTLAQRSLAAGSADGGVEVEKRVWELKEQLRPA